MPPGLPLHDASAAANIALIAVQRAFDRRLNQSAAWDTQFVRDVTNAARVAFDADPPVRSRTAVWDAAWAAATARYPPALQGLRQAHPRGLPGQLFGRRGHDEI